MKHIPGKDIETLKGLLIKEKADLEAELREHGRKVGTDWQGTPAGFESGESDDIDSADRMEELAMNVPLVETLEARLRDVDDALARIDAGTYGYDEETGDPIDSARLRANPAARKNIG